MTHLLFKLVSMCSKRNSRNNLFCSTKRVYYLLEEYPGKSILIIMKAPVFTGIRIPKDLSALMQNFQKSAH